MSLSLSAQETKITILEKNITIEIAFKQIEAQSKFTIAYNQTKFNAKKKIKLSINNSTIENALDRKSVV